MNDMLTTIARRYSCRDFTDQTLSEEQLQALALAAVQSPSARNRQPWRVIMVPNKALICEMDAEGMRVLQQMEDRSGYDRIMERGGRLFYNAPCMVMLPIDASNKAAGMDCGIVAQTVALAAASLGLNSVICGMARLAFAGGRAEEFRQRLGFPEGYEFGVSVLLGYERSPGTPHEADLAKISYVR